MNRHDREAWKSVRSMADLGDGVVAWLNGDLTETPGHLAPPDPETVPLADALTAINRAGLVTDQSQLAETYAGWTWNTWVQGFASGETLARLREAVAGTPLTLGACHSRVHECGRAWYRLRFCPRKNVLGQWADRCPAVAGELYGSWWVTVSDPEPGRNDRLWPALRDALTAEVAS